MSWLRILRLRDWAHFAILPLLSFAPATGPWADLVAGILAAAAGLAFAYGWNNWTDARLDRSRAKNPLSGDTPPRAAPLATVLAACAVLSGALAAWVGPLAFAAAALHLVGSALYSGGPRLKRIPVVGTLANLWIFAPLCFLAAGRPPLPGPFWPLLGLFSLLLLQNQLLHEVADRDEDAAQGVRTTAVVAGAVATIRIAALPGLAAVLPVLALSPLGPQTLVHLAPLLPVVFLSGILGLRAPIVAPHVRAVRLGHRVIGLLSGAALWATVTFP